MALPIYGGEISIIMQARGEPLAVLTALNSSINDVASTPKKNRAKRWTHSLANAICKEAIQRAPLGTGEKNKKTGKHLKATIEPHYKDGNWGVSVGEGLEPHNYAYYVEMGTSHRKWFQPFLRPALQAVLSRNDMSLAKEIWNNKELMMAMRTPVIRPVSVHATSAFLPGTGSSVIW